MIVQIRRLKISETPRMVQCWCFILHLPSCRIYRLYWIVLLITRLIRWGSSNSRYLDLFNNSYPVLVKRCKVKNACVMSLLTEDTAYIKYIGTITNMPSSGLDFFSTDELIHRLGVMLHQIKEKKLQKLDGPVYLADIPIQEDEDRVNTGFPPDNLIWPCKGDRLRQVPIKIQSVVSKRPRNGGSVGC